MIWIFWIYIRKSQWKILTHFYPIFLDLCHLIPLLKIKPFSTTFFRFRGDISPAGVPAIVNYATMLKQCSISIKTPKISKFYKLENENVYNEYDPFENFNCLGILVQIKYSKNKFKKPFQNQGYEHLFFILGRLYIN